MADLFFNKVHIPECNNCLGGNQFRTGDNGVGLRTASKREDGIVSR